MDERQTKRISSYTDTVDRSRSATVLCFPLLESVELPSSHGRER